MKPGNLEIRKIAKGAVAVFDKGSKTLFILPKDLAGKFTKAGETLEAAQELANDPKAVRLDKAKLADVSESLKALMLLG